MPRGGPRVGRVVGRVRRAVHERTAVPGTAPVDIGALIVPLRYDVVVRARFFDFLTEHSDLAGPALVQAAASTAYGDWFEHVECARYFPELLHDEQRREQRFAARVAGAVRLLQSFQEGGFDAASPVTLITAPVASMSDSGAPALERLHIGDGCHRLSLLLRDGATLEPWMYKVRPSLNTLVDNTAVLLRCGSLTEADYVAFLGGRFPVGDAKTVSTALSRVHAVDALSAEALGPVVDAQWRRTQPSLELRPTDA